jgi:hypothetical protein
LVLDPASGWRTSPINAEAVVLLTHRFGRPIEMRTGSDGATTERPVRLSLANARLYLAIQGDWGLRPLSGITSAPLLKADGTLFTAQGYDRESGFWFQNVPDVEGAIPSRPTFRDAQQALALVRGALSSFSFADAEFIPSLDCDGGRVDISKPPGRDESASLVALLTAVCRPSLHLAPGILIKAASLSGAGSGKGLLARTISRIAYGCEPHAVTMGEDSKEFEKRLAAELINGGQTVFIDNVNDTTLSSPLLASAISERPARVRILGRSEMMPLNPTALILITGNGLHVAEDLARRFITVELDPRSENPECREFKFDLRADIIARRAELLAALLTIWRWGRMADSLPKGKPLGSFEQWCEWVRDPLLALGCCDPAERVADAKRNDGKRQAIAELYALWWKIYRDRPQTAADLKSQVVAQIDPHKQSRQNIVARLDRTVGTRLAGFMLTKQTPAGKWTAATYTLKQTGGSEKP